MQNRKQFLWLGGVAVGCVAFALLFGHKTIASDEVGLVRNFGVVQQETLKPGWHFKAPWQTIDPITMSYSDLNFVQAEGDEGSIHSLTKDGIVVDVPVSVSWAIVPEQLTLVKTRLPGTYTEREYVIIRAAVRDAVAQFSVGDGSVFNREALQKAIDTEIRRQTVEYYAAQGFGVYADKIVRYGKIKVRGVFPPEEIQTKTEQVVSARLEALASAARAQVPSKQSVNDYTRVLQAQAVARAAADGKANVTVVSGNVPVVATAGQK